MDALDFWRLATFISVFLLLAVIIAWLCFWTQNKNRKRKLANLELSDQKLPLQKTLAPDIIISH